MSDEISEDLRLLAAIAYGEASVANDSNEIGGIAFAVANRCRAWSGMSVSQLRAADPNYAYAWNGDNQRFNKLMSTQGDQLDADAGMRLAVEWARKALANEGPDPSNGAFWWDGRDFMTRYASHPKVKNTFKWGTPSQHFRRAGESGIVYQTMEGGEQEDRKDSRRR